MTPPWCYLSGFIGDAALSPCLQDLSSNPLRRVSHPRDRRLDASNAAPTNGKFTVLHGEVSEPTTFRVVPSFRHCASRANFLAPSQMFCESCLARLSNEEFRGVIRCFFLRSVPTSIGRIPSFS